MTTVLAALAGLVAMTGGVVALVRVAYSARWPSAPAASRNRHRSQPGTADAPKPRCRRVLRRPAPHAIRTTGERHHRVHHGTFGNDRFGVLAERFARGFGTPQFIIGQTVVVVLWIGVNTVAFALRWDPYPFILLNLAFSTQAAYAAPLILLAQTRQAERDKARDAAVQEHRDAQVQQQELFESELRRMLDRDRERERAHEALLTRQGALIDEIARALALLQGAGRGATESAERQATVPAVSPARAARAPRAAPSAS